MTETKEGGTEGGKERGRIEGEKGKGEAGGVLV